MYLHLNVDNEAKQADYLTCLANSLMLKTKVPDSRNETLSITTHFVENSHYICAMYASYS